MQNKGQNKQTGGQKLLRLALLALALVLWLALGGRDKQPAAAPTLQPTQAATAAITQAAEKKTLKPAATSTPRKKSTATANPTAEPKNAPVPTEAAKLPQRDGVYTSKEDVAQYIAAYGELPQNFITKKEANALGWQGGDLRPFKKDACIGGDRFGNYEGRLPTKKGRVYYECDIDTLGKASRGPKRIVFSNDGLIYYTADHYETFDLLYGGNQ